MLLTRLMIRYWNKRFLTIDLHLVLKRFKQTLQTRKTSSHDRAHTLWLISCQNNYLRLQKIIPKERKLDHQVLGWDEQYLSKIDFANGRHFLTGKRRKLTVDYVRKWNTPCMTQTNVSNLSTPYIHSIFCNIFT